MCGRYKLVKFEPMKRFQPFYCLFSRPALLLAGALVAASLAMGASWNTGGGKKKETTRTGVFTSLKDMPLSMRQGFQYKGTLGSLKEQTGTLSMQTNAVWFQQGNHIYVIPHKQKVIFSRFKTPVQELK